MNFIEATNYLISLNNIPHKEYLKDKKDAEIYLKRIGYLLRLLKKPEKQIHHFIHITGTSGKGSVAMMLESILRASGKKTGLTTSPHPSAITERWAIQGKEISEKKFADLVMAIKPKVNEYIKHAPFDFLSFFEIVTAMGLKLFAEEKVDWAIVEVGLGGRYDSTNIIPNRDIAIITNIGRDHLNLIGPTLSDVTREKAGIIKKGCTIFTMEKNPRLLEIIKNECAKQKAKLNIIKQPKFVIKQTNLNGTTFFYQGNDYFLPVLGEHQIKNAILAIEVVRTLKISGDVIKTGLAKISLPLRMEIISKKPLIILDGAHNIDKMKTTVDTIKKIRQQGDIHLVLGFSADKDIKAMLRQIASLKPKTVVCTRSTSNPLRLAADPKLLQKEIKKLSPRVETKNFLDPQEAYGWTKQKTKDNDLLLVTGSFFLSGEIRNKNIKKR